MQFFKLKYTPKEIVTKSMRLAQHYFYLAQLKKSLSKNKDKVFYNGSDYLTIHQKILDMPGLSMGANITELHKIPGFSNAIEIVINEADRYCENEFNILGSGWTKWEDSSEISWHSDKINNYVWDKELFYTDVLKIIRSQIGSGAPTNEDCKIPRELSRFYFLFPLMFAYNYTEKQKYLVKIESTILNWIQLNQPYYGVNWSNAMEASIRLFNWCFCVYSLKETFANNTTFLNDFYRSIYQHFIFITKNLETLGNKNNHYVANVVGLFTMCFLFPVFKGNKKWLNWSVKQLENEIQRQTFNDGVGFECSTTYHRLALEMFFLPLYLSESLSIELFSAQYKDKVKKMFEFTLNILKPNGEVCQIGDNDNGRLFQLENRKALDHSYIPGLGFGLFADNQFCLNDFVFPLESYVLYGDKSYQQYQVRSKTSVQNLTSKAFADSGIYVLKNEDFILVISCQANSREVRGVHVHNDKLSFDLTYKSDNIIVDPGTVTYLGNTVIRNKYRSTSSHNTVQEKDLEQNNFGNNIFRMDDDARVTVNNFGDSFIDCQHDGFISKNGHLHRRTITMNKTEISIRDEIKSNDICKSFLHFDPSLQIKIDKNKASIIKNGELLLKLEFDNTESLTLENYEYSPGYGEVIEAQKLIISFKGFLNSKVITQR